MDFLKNQIQRIQQQLSGLTATQKMLTGALVAIMVMTLFYWGRYAGTADMEPLFDQALSPQDQGPIQSRLAMKGIKIVNGSGGQILVPAERRLEILSDLAYAKVLPRSTESGFEQMLVKLSPWASATERDAVYNRAKEITCGRLIGYFPEVEDAQVMIDPLQKRQIGISGGGIEPSATVTISARETTTPGKRREIAEAAAAVIVGAQAGMKPEHIKVVINGQPQRLRTGDAALDGGIAGGGDADEIFATKLRVEQATENRILEQFDNISGLRVKVSVNVNRDLVHREEKKFDPKAVLVKPVETESHESENSSGGSGNPEPGAAPNVGTATGPGGALEIGSSGAAGGQTNHETTEKQKNIVLPDQANISTTVAPGEVKVVSASIRVPHTYFVNALKLLSNLGDKAPDEKALQAYIVAESDRMREQVRGATGMSPEASVFVTDFPDVLPPPSSIAAVQQAAATMSIPTTIGKYGKEIALSGLALVSLFMVSMMVKKSAPAPLPVVQQSISTPTPLMAGEALAGEATEGGSMLDGMELDEDAIKTEQMLDQVSTLVKENPDGAAALVKRWLNRD